MKIRNGFVSNSSSNSFICDVCGNIESGYDASASDLGMAELTCGHTICEDHINEISEEEYKESALKDVKRKLDESVEKNYKWYLQKYTNCYGALLNCTDFKKFKNTYKDTMDCKYVSAQCPICNFSVIRDKDILNFLVIKNGLTKEKISDLVREELKNGNLKLV